MRTLSFKVYAAAAITVGTAITGSIVARRASLPAAADVTVASASMFGGMHKAAPPPMAAIAEQSAPAAAPTRDLAPAPSMRPVTRQVSATPPVNAASFWAAQRLIRSGELRVLVKDVRRAIDIADSVGRRHGAMLADSRTSSDARTTQNAQLQFRVPADRFDETVAALRSIGDVRGESINTQDVTKDYADLDTRLRVKDETVTRLRTLLATHTAKLADVLEVEEELARAVTELEQLKGERNYYDQRIAMSSLSVSLFEQQVVPPRARFTDPVVAASRRALEVLGSSLAGVTYGVVFLLPWVVLATIMWWVFTLLRPRISVRNLS